MAIRGILFDKDGTLIEANATWVPVYKAMLAKEMNADEAQVIELLSLAGYDRETDGFKAGSVLAAGTIDQLVDIWWPHFDAASKRAKVQKANFTRRIAIHDAIVYSVRDHAILVKNRLNVPIIGPFILAV